MRPYLLTHLQVNFDHLKCVGGKGIYRWFYRVHHHFQSSKTLQLLLLVISQQQ